MRAAVNDFELWGAFGGWWYYRQAPAALVARTALLLTGKAQAREEEQRRAEDRARRNADKHGKGAGGRRSRGRAPVPPPGGFEDLGDDAGD